MSCPKGLMVLTLLSVFAKPGCGCQAIPRLGFPLLMCTRVLLLAKIQEYYFSSIPKCLLRFLFSSGGR